MIHRVFFFPSRLITDNALIAYECLHHLRLTKEGKRCYVAMKLDMSKVIDKVEWCFRGKNVIENWLFRMMGEKDNEMCRFSALFF